VGNIETIEVHQASRQRGLRVTARSACAAAGEGDQCRSVVDRTAPEAAEPSGGGSASQQDRAHRLGGDAPAGELPARGRGCL